MSKNPRSILFLIILITIAAVVINIPKQIKLSLTTPKLPFLQKQFTINKTFPGFNPDFYLGSLHFKRDLSFRKGLDLEGGTSITLRANMNGIPQGKRKEALESAKTVIAKRVNFFGVSEPVVQTAIANNDYRIIVEIPGVTDVNQAVSLVGKTAKLSFWEEGASGSAKMASSSAAPVGANILLGQNPRLTSLTGSDLQEASVTFNPNTGKPQVQLSFTSQGTRKFAEITKRNVGKIVLIALDNQVIEAPRVNEAITTGNAVITGGFTTEQAKALAIQLNAGALPVSLSVLEQHAIGATLGAQSLQKSLFAGFLGFIVIVVFMLVLYGRLGLLASLALVLYTLIVSSLFRLIPITLTLAGIAGFILSIGMAVDANILIFERIREEVRRGRAPQTALELGFVRAWASIRDSNMASLITSAILYYFGTGIVKGFALTLALGVLVSMFSAIVVTRTLLRVWYKG